MKPIQNQRQNQNIAGKPQDPTRNFGQPLEKKPMESNKKPMDNKSSGKCSKPEDRSCEKFGRSQDQHSRKH
ncbi:MAG: hypothetical protein K0R48_327 [Gammaproteobacteria bacterium]|jgi:hypothetical protein|nr:hypothetical protein [Gammaproteobacteria bacterium]